MLGAILLTVIVLFVSCSGGDDAKHGQGTSSSQYPTPAPAKSSPDTSPSFLTAAPGGGGPALPQPGDVTPTATGSAAGTGTGSGTGTGTGGANGTGSGTNGNVNATAPTGDTCTDAELSVTPVPATTSTKRGTPLAIQIKIKNIGTRTCNRDLGAGAQELYIDQGAQKVWSSDTCSTNNDSDVKSLPAGTERDFAVTWNGHSDAQCQGDQASGPVPAAGAYQIRTRVSTKVSDPVTLAVVA